MRSDTLMRGMHQVCNHDLPNQIVALQSLLQMLQLEEFTRLSRDGQEYVQRLQKVTQRTSAMARFLKEMGKLQGYIGKPEELSFPVLAREIQGALKQQFPHKPFSFDWRWNIPSVVADYRTFVQALNEILTCLASRFEGPCRLSATTEESDNHAAIHFALETSPGSHDNDSYMVALRAGPSSFDQRMEIILARAWLAVSEATLVLTLQENQTSRFSILVPNQ